MIRSPSLTVLVNNTDDASLMSIHRIPVNKLSREALKGVIEEFISRDGTDYCEVETSAETKFRYVKQKLEKGLAVLIFDDEAETTNIFLADDPILKRIHYRVIVSFSFIPNNDYLVDIHGLSLNFPQQTI